MSRKSKVGAETVVAMVGGALVGALFGLCSDGPTPPEPTSGGAPAPRTTNARGSRVGESGAGGSPAHEPTVSRVPAAGSGPAPSPARNDPSGLLAELERSCARQRPHACLEAARAHEQGRDVAADRAKARVHRALAVSLLDQRCYERDPESCETLAELYREGVGVVKNDETATLLARRAVELCQGRSSAVCDRLRAGVR